MEENYEEKLNKFADAIYCEEPDIIALQEVNQTCCRAPVPQNELVGFCPCNAFSVIREDNHVFNTVRKLRRMGIAYYWTWLGMKVGYDKYDEGIAFMSKSPITDTDVLLVSNVNDYSNWKTRKIIGIHTKAAPNEWFYSVHYGWWNDDEEPFQSQWAKTASHMKQHETAWLMGDFNSPAEVRGEGYDMIKAAGWYDSYLQAAQKDSGITVGKVIDGWREKLSSTNGMRIDQIWCNQKSVVKSSRVFFNGCNHEVVSDHFGVMIEKQ